MSIAVRFWNLIRTGRRCIDGSYTVPGIDPLPAEVLNARFPWITEQLRQGKTLVWSRIPDDLPEEATAEQQYALKIGTKSGLNIPIFADGSVMCAISFTSIRSFRIWPDDLIPRLRVIGDIFANALVRKRMDEALRQSEAKFRALFESNVVPMAYWHADGRILDANGVYLQLTGYTREELKAGQMHCDALTPPEYHHLDRRAVDELMFGRENCTPFEKEYVLRDGRCVPVLIAGSLLPGYKDRGVVFVIDLTERKRADQALRESEALNRAILSSLQSHIAVLDQQGTIVAINEAWADLARKNGLNSMAMVSLGANYLGHASELQEKNPQSRSTY